MGLMQRIDVKKQADARRERIRAHMPRIMHINKAHGGEHCDYHNCTWLRDWPVR